MNINKKKQTPIMVSIRCAVYNQEKYIRQCLDGFVMQKTKFRFEVIVHDDASTDDTVSIIKKYSESYPEIIKPIFEKENQYSKHDGSIRKIMDTACSGKYIAFCEGDDYWTDPLKLQKQVDILESNPDVSFVYTGFQTVDSESVDMYREKYEEFLTKSHSGDILKELIVKGNFIMTLTTCFRREVFDSDIMKESSKGMDYLYFLVAASMGNAVFLPEKTGCYRYSENSEMNSNLSFVQNRYMDIKRYIINAILEKKIGKRSSIKRISLYTGIMSNALSIYKNGVDKMYLKSILKKKRSLYLLLPIALFSLILNKLDR